MNDIGYTDEKFEGSICENTIETADKDGLKNLLYYSKGAVIYHTKEQNPQQVIFFQSAANLCNKRLKRLGA